MLKNRRGVTKIGITRRSNYHSRMKKIEKDFKSVIDKDKSWIFVGKDEKVVHDIEQILHRVFRDCNVSIGEGVGKTEWFSVSSKEVLREAMKIMGTKRFGKLQGPYSLSGEKKRDWDLISEMILLFAIVLSYSFFLLW